MFATGGGLVLRQLLEQSALRWRLSSWKNRNSSSCWAPRNGPAGLGQGRRHLRSDPSPTREGSLGAPLPAARGARRRRWQKRQQGRHKDVAREGPGRALRKLCRKYNVLHHAFMPSCPRHTRRSSGGEAGRSARRIEPPARRRRRHSWSSVRRAWPKKVGLFSLLRCLLEKGQQTQQN